MKRILISLSRYFLTFVIAFFVMLGILLISTLVPQKCIQDNMVSSSKEVMNKPEFYNQVSSLKCPRSAMKPADGITAACMWTTVTCWMNCSC